MLDSDDTLYFSEYNEYTAAYEQLTTLKGVVLGDMPAFIVREKACTQKIMIMDEAERIPQLVEEYQQKFKGALLANQRGEISHGNSSTPCGTRAFRWNFWRCATV